MQISYVVERDRETKTVDLIARFVDGVPEVYKNGKWKVNGFVTSIQQDGRLEDISEADIEQLFNLYNDFIVLCLLNVGQYGVDNINDTVEQMILHYLNGKLRINLYLPLMLSKQAEEFKLVTKKLNYVENIEIYFHDPH